MSFQIRYYQREAIEAVYEYFSNKNGNPILALPTGTGKSIIIAELLRSIFHYFPGQRVLMLTHVKELISQNYEKLLSIWPMAPCGIYSAGLGKREIRPITFAGIASVSKKAHLFGKIDLIIIDECHLVSPKQETSYQNFISDLQQENPLMKVIGLTATPYRLGQGLLTKPVYSSKTTRQPLFTDIAYDLTKTESFTRLIAEGYLCRLVPKQTKEQLDFTGVRTVAGEFNLLDLQAAVDRNEITKRAVDEIIKQGTEGNRTRWLVFATGIDHAEHVTQEFRHRGFNANCVHSKTNSKERDRLVEWFKLPYCGQPVVMVNNGVFTTGFDCPMLDLIAVLRATLSPALWVQMLGRGTRPYPGKENCLVLDFAANTRRLGPINDPVLPKAKRGKGKGDAPVKVCEACGVYNHASVRYCTECNEEFSKATKFKDKAAEEELIKESEAPLIEVFPVDLVSYLPHFPKNKQKQTSLKVIYKSGLREFSEWICIEHDGYAGKKARDWWRLRMGSEPPETVESAIEYVDDLKTPSHIRVFVNKKHPEILAYDFTGSAFGAKPAKPFNPLEEENIPF